MISALIWDTYFGKKKIEAGIKIDGENMYAQIQEAQKLRQKASRFYLLAQACIIIIYFLYVYIQK
jgi:hypothetical protein